MAARVSKQVRMHARPPCAVALPNTTRAFQCQDLNYEYFEVTHERRNCVFPVIIFREHGQKLAASQIRKTMSTGRRQSTHRRHGAT
eukprot:7390102-Prymnesium_polylepis.1